MSATVVAETDDAALEWLHANRCTDGAPVVIPTRERVARLVVAGGLDADLTLGRIGPNLGEATVEKVAACAVMAGCTPDHLPVVVASVRAMCDPVLDLTEVQATTHNLGPLVIVNGPVRHFAGISGGWGALGYGHRANVSIGRAIRLCLINIGGGWPGVSDMALLGHPGKLSYCLAEDEEASPFPPLHTSLGYEAEQSAITAVCVEAPHSVLAFLDADDSTSAERLLVLLGRTVASLGTNNSHFGRGAVVVVLNPDHAAVLHAAGHDRPSIQAGVFHHAANRLSEIRAVLPPASAANRKGHDDDLVRALASPDQVLVLVAGGGGLYSTVMPSWGAGPHGNTFVTQPVDLDQSCEIPGASQVR